MKGYWTLPQALTWLIYGRIDPALDLSPFDIVNASVRSGRGPHALAARDRMHDSLMEGDLVAHGIAIGTQEHVAIPPTAWLTLDTLSSSHPNIPPNAAGSNGKVRYYLVCVRAGDIRGLWPGGTQSPPTTKDGALKVIHEERIKKGGDLTMREADRLCADKCAGISRKIFRELVVSVQGHKKQGRPVTATKAPD